MKAAEEDREEVGLNKTPSLAELNNKKIEEINSIQKKVDNSVTEGIKEAEQLFSRLSEAIEIDDETKRELEAFKQEVIENQELLKKEVLLCQAVIQTHQSQSSLTKEICAKIRSKIEKKPKTERSKEELGQNWDEKLLSFEQLCEQSQKELGKALENFKKGYH